LGALDGQSHEVRLSEEGRFYLLEQQDERQIRHDSKPHTSFGKRSVVFLLSMLPIKWLL